MDRRELKQKAIELRLQGFTYREIGEQLGVAIPKGTISGWFKGLELSQIAHNRLLETQRAILTDSRCREKAIIANRIKREAYLLSVRERNQRFTGKLINADVAKIALAMLYLGEGTKGAQRGCVLLGNTNPQIILLYIRLLDTCYAIDRTKLRCKIQCRADQDIPALIQFWSKLLDLSTSQFYPTYIDKRTIGKPTRKLDYKGVCAVYYFSADIFHDIMTTIDILMGH